MSDEMRRNSVIEAEVDYMARVSEGWQRRALVAADAGAKLAHAVYTYLDDPEGVGTDALAAAREEFMGLHAGNFVCAGVPA